MDEQDKERINIDDIPQGEEELAPDEAKGVQGGAVQGTNTWTGPITLGSSSATAGDGSVRTATPQMPVKES